MGSIVKRKTEEGLRYQAHVRRKGHKARAKTFIYKTKAKDWITSVEAAIKEHRDLPEREALRQTFAELVEVILRSEAFQITSPTASSAKSRASSAGGSTC